MNIARMVVFSAGVESRDDGTAPVFTLTLRQRCVFGKALARCPVRIFCQLWQDEEAMEFSALAKAFSASDEVCRCILKSDFLKVIFGQLLCRT